MLMSCTGGFNITLMDSQGLLVCFQSYGVFRIPIYIASSFRFLVCSCCHITC